MKALQYILVGILFFGALGTVAFFTIITEGGPLKKEVNAVKVFFPSAEGLKIGSKVTVHGVPFGYVSKVNLVDVDMEGNVIEDNTQNWKAVGTRVEVTIVTPKPLKVFENYDIKIRNESLLSGRVIAINPGSESSEDPKLKEKKHQIIDFRDPTKAKSLKGKTADDPLVLFSELIAENRSDVRKIFANVADVTEKINSGKGTLGKLINNDEIHTSVNTTLTDAQIVLRELREGLEDTREQAPVTSFIRAALTAF
jgi:phospholipid/cholesterol/gamma-HCH transport system substrate-binding protein